MRVLLINPPLHQNTIRSLGPIAGNLFYNSPPLGLCYLASFLKEDGNELKIVDAAVEKLSIDRIIKRTANFLPDIVGISTFSVSAVSSYELAKEIKMRFPETKIVAGGPHITSNTDDLLKHPEIDIAVIGEGEITFRELIRVLEKGGDINKVNGLAYRAEGTVFLTRAREFISELDILPFPARELVPIKLYKPQPNDQRKLPKLSMISSRGCPYSCIFCDKGVFKEKYRSFSPKYIVREMSYLVKKFKARDIAFVDSNFTPNKNRVYEIIKEIKKSNLDVPWTCSIRVNSVDRELLQEMKDVGCWRVRLGVESGNEEVLKFIKKGITKYQVKKAANWAYQLDLEPKGFFMLGHLTDTKQTIEETMNFACNLPLKDITVQTNTPLKNTPQYLIAEKYGRIVTEDFSNYTFWEPIFLPKGISYNELYRYYRKFYLKFYLRPKIWYRHSAKIKSLSDIKKYIKGIGILFFFLISWLKEKF